MLIPLYSWMDRLKALVFLCIFEEFNQMHDNEMIGISFFKYKISASLICFCCLRPKWNADSISRPPHEEQFDVCHPAACLHLVCKVTRHGEARGVPVEGGWYDGPPEAIWMKPLIFSNVNDPVARGNQSGDCIVELTLIIVSVQTRPSHTLPVEFGSGGTWSLR